ncbi:MAG: carbohydrate kinase [Kiloniellales bacterium]|nr:carbohydrate kinase [Kiloniellales bacterium]
MERDLLLSLDAGGTAVKAAVFSRDGELTCLREADVRTDHRPNGWVERDPETFWGSAAAALKDITQKDVDPQRIAAVCCTGFGNGAFLVDQNGRGVRPGIVSVDHRAQGIVEELESDGRHAGIEAIGGQRLWGGQTATQLVWLSREEPDSCARSRWVLLCKDFVRMRLTGRAATDLSDASGGGLLNYRTAAYDPALFALLGVLAFTERLPPLLRSTAVAGKVSAEASAETGLLEGTPVATGMMDVGACVLGSGVFSDDVLTMIAGTWAIIGLQSAEPVNGRPPVLQMIHDDRRCFLTADGSPTSAANLNWYASQALPGDLSYDRINALVQDSDPAKQPRCYFLPYVNGPAPRRGCFLGLTSSDDQATMLRAIYEAVAFRHRHHAETVKKFFPDREIKAIRLSGGASRSLVWPQVFADVNQIRVEVVDGQEIGALGAAICAAVAAGFHDDLESAASAMCRVSSVFEPDSTTKDLYEQRYAEFMRLDEAMSAVDAGAAAT